jgi:chromosome segregation ATPase
VIDEDMQMQGAFLEERRLRDALERENAELRQTVQELTAKLKRARDDAERNREPRPQNPELQSRLQVRGDGFGQLSGLACKADTAAEKFRRMKQQRSSLQAEVATARHEADSLRQELAVAKRRCEDLADAKREADAANERITDRLNALGTEVSKLRRTVGALGRANAKLNSENSQLSALVQVLKDKKEALRQMLEEREE